MLTSWKWLAKPHGSLSWNGLNYASSQELRQSFHRYTLSPSLYRSQQIAAI